MSNSTTEVSDRGSLSNELTCYVKTDAVDIVLGSMHTLKDKYGADYSAKQYCYELPLGSMSLLELILYLPSNSRLVDIETVRIAAIKAALAWYRTGVSDSKENEMLSYEVLTLDIQLIKQAKIGPKNEEHTHKHGSIKRIKHGFGVRYFMEDLVVDMSDSMQQLQVFSWHDWHSILAALQTPCELWLFLTYHLEQLQSSSISNEPSFESEEALISEFLQQSSLFATAIEVDKALIKYGIQDEPNPALIAMTLAYNNQSTTSQMYHQHMQQAATLWSNLSTQMIEMYGDRFENSGNHKSLEIKLHDWQQQLLDESLFSRYELISTLYRHPKQPPSLQKEGYVVHQHSYESLGRHYVLVFYGQDVEGSNSKGSIQPNLAKIAQDVATRLPIAELHHVIVLGINFIAETNDTFIDIDLWIQPVDEMTQRERQLTKQLQLLQQELKQYKSHSKSKQTSSPKNNMKGKSPLYNHLSNGLPQVRLSLSVPVRNDEP